MKEIWIFNAQLIKIPQFKSLLTRKQARWLHIFIAFFYSSYVMNVDYAKFQKMLIVEQFQGVIPLKLLYYCSNFLLSKFHKQTVSLFSGGNPVFHLDI